MSPWVDEELVDAYFDGEAEFWEDPDEPADLFVSMESRFTRGAFGSDHAPEVFSDVDGRGPRKHGYSYWEYHSCTCARCLAGCEARAARMNGARGPLDAADEAFTQYDVEVARAA